MTDPDPARRDAHTSEAMQFLWINAGEAELATSIDLPRGRGPWPVVVIVPGFSGDRIGRSYHFVEFGRRLNALGIACVRFDHAGCGESTGDQTLYSMRTVERDCLAVGEYVADDPRFDHTRLGIVGSSLGALGGVMMAARYRAKGLLLWAPVCDLPGLTAQAAPREYIEKVLDEIGFAPYKGVRMGPTYFDYLAHLDPDEHLTTYRGPVFIAHSRNDESVPIEHAHQFVELCRRHDLPCELLEFDGTTHDFHLEPERSKLLGESVARLRQWLS